MSGCCHVRYDELGVAERLVDLIDIAESPTSRAPPPSKQRRTHATSSPDPGATTDRRGQIHSDAVGRHLIVIVLDDE